MIQNTANGLLDHNVLAMLRAAFVNTDFLPTNLVNKEAGCSCLQLIAVCSMSLCYGLVFVFNNIQFV